MKFAWASLAMAGVHIPGPEGTVKPILTRRRCVAEEMRRGVRRGAGVLDGLLAIELANSGGVSNMGRVPGLGELQDVIYIALSDKISSILPSARSRSRTHQWRTFAAQAYSAVFPQAIGSNSECGWPAVELSPSVQRRRGT